MNEPSECVSGLGEPREPQPVPIWVTIARFMVGQCRGCDGKGWSAKFGHDPRMTCPDCKDLRALVEGKGEGHGSSDTKSR